MRWEPCNHKYPRRAGLTNIVLCAQSKERRERDGPSCSELTLVSCSHGCKSYFSIQPYRYLLCNYSLHQLIHKNMIKLMFSWPKDWINLPCVSSHVRMQCSHMWCVSVSVITPISYTKRRIVQNWRVSKFRQNILEPSTFRNMRAASMISWDHIPDHTNSESWQSEIIRTNSFDIFCLGVFYCGSDVADSQSAEYSSSDAKTRQDRDNNAVTVTTPIIVKTYSSLLLQSLSERRIESFNLLFTPQQSLMNECKIKFSDWPNLLLRWLSEFHMSFVKSEEHTYVPYVAVCTS